MDRGAEQEAVCRFTDLPDQILIDIIERRLTPLCRVRFAAASNTSALLIQRLFPPLSIDQQLPWLITYRIDSIYLHWPNISGNGRYCSADCHQEPAPLMDELFPGADDRQTAEPFMAKFGWVVYRLDTQTGTRLCLYSPYTRKTICPPKLPCLDFKFHFSRPPVSPDCLFVAFSRFSDCLSIYACGPGDENWEIYDVVKVPGDVENVIFLGGSFYCLFKYGTVGVFNLDVSDKTWDMLTEIEPLKGCGNFYSFSGDVSACGPCRESYVVESVDGDLLLVLAVEYPWLNPDRLLVWRYNVAARQWTKVTRLDDQVVFLDSRRSGSGKAVPAVGKLEGFANRLYFQSHGYHSLVDGKTSGGVDFGTSRSDFGFWNEPPSPGSNGNWQFRLEGKKSPFVHVAPDLFARIP